MRWPNGELDFSGVEDGPNSQDDTCSESTFTRMGGMGAHATFELPDGSAIAKGAQINVWTAASACSLIAAGEKPFRVTVGDAMGEGPVESCAGTCTITAP